MMSFLLSGKAGARFPGMGGVYSSDVFVIVLSQAKERKQREEMESILALLHRLE
jgi:hypothetical protein